MFVSTAAPLAAPRAGGKFSNNSSHRQNKGGDDDDGFADTDVASLL